MLPTLTSKHLHQRLHKSQNPDRYHLVRVPVQTTAKATPSSQSTVTQAILLVAASSLDSDDWKGIGFSKCQLAVLQNSGIEECQHAERHNCLRVVVTET